MILRILKFKTIVERNIVNSVNEGNVNVVEGLYDHDTFKQI